MSRDALSLATHETCESGAQNEKGLRHETQALEFFGGRYWDRTSDPCCVKGRLHADRRQHKAN